MSDSRELLLLSGGLESTAIAAWRRPAATLTIDYGQKPAPGEIRAATAVAQSLELPHHVLTADCSEVGSGLLADVPAAGVAPCEEWWPFRNQLLITLAGAWGLPRGFDVIVVGSVRTDSQHLDGTEQFFRDADQLTSTQEGGIRVLAPAIALSTEELLQESAIPASLLGWTHSCHRGPAPCGDCPGCAKRNHFVAHYEALACDV